MPNLPISGLPQATSLDGTEILPFVQGGVTTQATAQDILNANLPVTSSGITVSGDIVPTTPQGATLGTIDKPFESIYLQSGSISIESDTPGDPSAIISNVSGNLEITVGGMLLVEPQASFIAPTGSFSYLSGSFFHEGTAERLGNTIVTGSFAVSGSTTQIGNNTLDGNTILSGSVDISGSFETDLEENLVFLGDLNGRSTPTTLDALAYSGSLVQKAYGSFFDSSTQSGSADTAYAVKHNTTDISGSIRMVDDTKITVDNAGVYTIISTQQFVHTSGGTATITGWLRKNGSDVPNSATDLKLKGNGDKDLYAINYMVELTSNDYVELIWSADDSDTEIQATAGRTSPTRPAVPSVITTINRVG